MKHQSGNEIKDRLEGAEDRLTDRLTKISPEEIKNLDEKEAERILAFLEARLKELRGDSSEMGQDEEYQTNPEDEKKKRKLAQATDGDLRTSQEKENDFQVRKRAMSKARAGEELRTRNEDSGQTQMRHERELEDQKRLEKSYGKVTANKMLQNIEKAEKFGGAGALELAYTKYLKSKYYT